MKALSLLVLVCLITVSVPCGAQAGSPSPAFLADPVSGEGSLPQDEPPGDRSSWMDDLMQVIQEAMQSVGEAISTALGQVLEFLLRGLKQMVQEAWQDTKDKAAEAVNEVLDGWKEQSCLGAFFPFGVMGCVWVLRRKKIKK